MKHLWSILAFAAVSTCHAANWYPIVINGQIMTDYQPTVINWVDPYYANLAFLHNFEATNNSPAPLGSFVDAVGKYSGICSNNGSGFITTNRNINANINGRMEHAISIIKANHHWLNITNGPCLPSASSFTLSVWVWENGATWNDGVYYDIYFESFNGNQDVTFNIGPNRYPRFAAWNGGGYVWTTSTVQVVTNTWTHLLVTKSGTAGSIWVNGVSNTVAGSMLATFLTPRTYSTIGALVYSGGSGSEWDGMLDDLRLYTNLVLSAQAISNLVLYTNPTNNIEQR